MYELLVGLPPYFNNDRNILFQNIRFGILRYPSWEISSVAKNLIEQVNMHDYHYNYMQFFSFYVEILKND